MRLTLVCEADLLCKSGLQSQESAGLPGLQRSLKETVEHLLCP